MVQEAPKDPLPAEDHHHHEDVEEREEVVQEEVVEELVVEDAAVDAATVSTRNDNVRRNVHGQDPAMMTMTKSSQVDPMMTTHVRRLLQLDHWMAEEADVVMRDPPMNVMKMPHLRQVKQPRKDV